MNQPTYLRTSPDPAAGELAVDMIGVLFAVTLGGLAWWFSIGAPFPPLILFVALAWGGATRVLLDRADTEQAAAANGARVVAVMGYVSAAGARLELPDGLDGDLRSWDVLSHATVVDPTGARSSLERVTIDGAGYVIVRPAADTNLTIR